MMCLNMLQYFAMPLIALDRKIAFLHRNYVSALTSSFVVVVADYWLDLTCQIILGNQLGFLPTTVGYYWLGQIILRNQSCVPPQLKVQYILKSNLDCIR